MRMRAFAVALAALVLVPPRAAQADDASPTAKDRARAAAIAVVPGVVVHGAGQWSARRPSAARALLVAELVGLGAMATAGTVLYLTGASRRIVAPAAAVAVLGGGLFVTSWLADLWGAGTGGEPLGEPRRVLPAVEASLGYRHVADPAFAYRSFAVSTLDLRAGAVRVTAEGWFAIGHANERVRLLASHRLAGARPVSLDGRRTPRPAGDGSFVDLGVAGVRHAFPPERFTLTSIELGAEARLDLARLAPELAGAFVDASLGWALTRHSYRVRGAPSDAADQLLARWAHGVWFGRPDRAWGEASLFYEHRHDSFAGGLKLPGLFSGVPGSVGARAFAWVTPELGGLVEAQVGSAVVLGASLLVRQPVTP